MDSTEITVATWNIAWAPPDGPRGPMVRQRLAATTADVLVVTETELRTWPGHSAERRLSDHLGVMCRLDRQS